MAGMLPGVECARRRRIHQGGSGMSSDPPSTAACGWSRRSYFSLFTSSHETNYASAAAQRHLGGEGGYRDDVNLGGAAREAKERLDVKLRYQLKSDFGRSSHAANGQSSVHVAGGAALAVGNLQTEVFRMRKDGGGSRVGGSFRMLKWARLNWRAMDQEECAVCLDRFRVGENLINLPCAHRFHTRCLVPWLESNSHCPCCRMDVQHPLTTH